MESLGGRKPKSVDRIRFITGLALGERLARSVDWNCRIAAYVTANASGIKWAALVNTC